MVKPDSPIANPAEPSLLKLPGPVARYLLATRPAFLSVTLVGCILGVATAVGSGIALKPWLAVITVLFALLAHAGANVINDYHDALSGCDAANTERIFPFTGGSRFIQNGVLSLEATRTFGYALLVAVIPAGMLLTWRSGPELLLIGLTGLLAGWAYSAPPLKLQSRGLGEWAITTGWLLVIVGSDFVQRGTLSFMPVASGTCFALLVANVLYINQFPDAKADGATGKRTLVVRLGPSNARWGYVGIAALAYAWLLAMILTGRLPTAAGLALLPVGVSVAAGKVLWRHAATPSGLAPALKLTILASLLHGVLMVLAQHLASVP